MQEKYPGTLFLLLWMVIFIKMIYCAFHSYKVIAAAFIILTAVGCSRKVVQHGTASYYADAFQGRKTASGARFSQHKRTAASLTIPLGTRARVINTANGRKVRVRINDRGPYAKGRIIDLSRKAARKLRMINAGTAQVIIKYKKR